jgi:hypothetical protein
MVANFTDRPWAWSTLNRRLLALPLFLLAGGFAAAQARLEHSAPWLGQTLAFDVFGAPPNQLVELYYSTGGDSFPTPFGTAELQRAGIRRLAVRTTDGSGHVSFGIPVPLDSVLAENEAHFQALVTDPSTPAGKTFTNANHLKLLGTRVYAHERSHYPDPVQGGLEIIDAVHGVVSAHVDFGSISDAELRNVDGKPVFSKNFDCGAVMASSTRLVFFDPFFGTVRGEFPLAPCSRVLWTDASQARVFVLEMGTSVAPAQPARLLVFEFASASPIGTLPLPEPASDTWCTSLDQSSAFIGAFDATSGAAILRRVSLATLSVQDAVALGTSLTAVFDHMEFAAGQVFVSSHEPSVSLYYAAWTRVDTSSGTMSASIASSTVTWFPRFVAVPVLDLMLLSKKWNTLPASGLQKEPLTTSEAAVPVPQPGGYLNCDDMVTEGSTVWIMDTNRNSYAGDDDPSRLLRVDLTSNTWREYPRTWPFEGPRDLEIVHDALSDQVLLACPSVPQPIGTAAAVFVFDRSAGVERWILTARSPESLLAVPIP